MITLEVPFIAEEYKRQTMLLFHKNWHPNWKSNNRRLIWFALFLIFGLGILYFYERNSGYLFIGIAVYYLIKYYEYYSHYSDTKKSLQKRAEEVIAKYQNIEGNSIWEFNEEFFFCSFDGYEVKITWHNFERYEVIDDCIFAYRKHNNELLITLSKQEVGEEAFEKILHLIQEKIES